MTPLEAQATIIRHARWSDSGAGGGCFLASLRPYRGWLPESAFLELISAVGILSRHDRRADQVNRAVMEALWEICWLGRRWGIDPDGMLQRNRLISPEDTRTLESWINRLSEAVWHMLCGRDTDEVARSEATTQGRIDGEATLRRLVALFPTFKAYWDGPGDGYRYEDDSFSPCMAFGAFSGFFRAHYEQLPPDRVATLGAFISECVSATGTEVAAAATTCFLETVAGERFSPDFQRHLTGEAFRFYLEWNGPTG